MIPRRSLFALLLVGCSCAASLPTRLPAPPPYGGFKSPDARLLACIDLQDKTINLYLQAYQDENPGDLDGMTPAVFREAWTSELEKSGAFDRFEKSCFYSLTTEERDCAMGAMSVNALRTCLGHARR